jgi:hypothetical protein
METYPNSRVDIVVRLALLVYKMQYPDLARLRGFIAMEKRHLV